MGRGSAQTPNPCIGRPSRPLIEQAFTESFKRAIPVDESYEFFEGVNRSAGNCTTHILVGTASEYHARYEVTCATRMEFVTVAIEHEPPHRIRGLLIKPKR